MEIQPGSYAGIPIDAYHGGPGISKSGLDQIDRSPAHYWQAYLNPARARRETPALKTGHALHTAILEPHLLETQYAAAPDADRRTTVGKAAWAAFLETAQGKTPLDKRDMDRVRYVGDAVRSHPVAAVLLSKGRVELTHYWENQGVLCKCRPDFHTDDGWLVDLKSTQDARQEAFARSIWEYRYHVQAPWYLDGVMHASGVRPRGFIFIAMEKEPPYLVACYAASPRMIARGRTAYERNLATYRACLAADDWPGYPDVVAPIDLPPWADKMDARQII